MTSQTIAGSDSFQTLHGSKGKLGMGSIDGPLKSETGNGPIDYDNILHKRYKLDRVGLENIRCT